MNTSRPSLFLVVPGAKRMTRCIRSTCSTFIPANSETRQPNVRPHLAPPCLEDLGKGRMHCYLRHASFVFALRLFALRPVAADVDLPEGRPMTLVFSPVLPSKARVVCYR